MSDNNEPPKSPTGALADAIRGARFLGRGLAMYVRSPRLMLLGLIPAMISSVLLIVGLVGLVLVADDLASLATPFADDWATGARTTIRIVAAVAVVGVGVVLEVLVFTALTLLIGEPFYEAISARVDDSLGGVPGGAIDVPFWRSLPRSIANSARLFAFAAVCGVPLFVAGFIPVVGETVVPVLGASVAGWVLALELTGVAFERRGLSLPDRRQRLRARPALSLGFGVATFACFLIPLGAVLVMPAAVAGATLLTRELFGQSVSPADRPHQTGHTRVGPAVG